MVKDRQNARKKEREVMKDGKEREKGKRKVKEGERNNEREKETGGGGRESFYLNVCFMSNLINQK